MLNAIKIISECANVKKCISFRWRCHLEGEVEVEVCLKLPRRVLAFLESETIVWNN